MQFKNHEYGKPMNWDQSHKKIKDTFNFPSFNPKERETPWLPLDFQMDLHPSPEASHEIKHPQPDLEGCPEMDNPFRIGNQKNRRGASILESRTGPSHYKQTVLKTYDL
ncbi:unnamed protein product [Amaranthus hypochondriacus]